MANAVEPFGTRRQAGAKQGQVGWQLRACYKGGEAIDYERKGKGSPLMVAGEAHGLPIAFLVSPHSTHESQLALPALAQLRIPKQGRGRPQTRIKELAMDTAFDSQELRQTLRRRGIKASAPKRKRRGKRRQKGPHPKLYPVSQERWMVERVNAWHDNYRGLVVRYDRKAAHYRAYVVLCAILLCLRRLLTPD